MDKRTEIISLRLDQISNGYLLNQKPMPKLNDEIANNHTNIRLNLFFLFSLKPMWVVSILPCAKFGPIGNAHLTIQLSNKQ